MLQTTALMVLLYLCFGHICFNVPLVCQFPAVKPLLVSDIVKNT